MSMPFVKITSFSKCGYLTPLPYPLPYTREKAKTLQVFFKTPFQNLHLLYH
jgi:hypothetical protein